jgi:hypothetical protein
MDYQPGLDNYSFLLDMSYSLLLLFNSERGTLMSFRASVLKRSIGLDDPALAARAFSASLSVSSVRFCRRAIRSRQLRIGQPPTGNRRTHLPKPLAIVMLSLV